MTSFVSDPTMPNAAECWFGLRRIRSKQRRQDPDRAAKEAGFTLVEILITVAILSVVLAITTPVVTAFYDVNGDVQQSFTATNQLVLASESLTQYLHEAVAPCPTGSSECSTTAFSSTTAPSATSLTFYADTGNANGPVEVVMTTARATMTATVYNPTAGSCPFNGSLTTGCSYPTASHLLVSVPDLTNASASYPNSIFSYDVGTGSNSCTTTSPTASSILAVCLNFQADLKGGQPTGYQSLAFALASSYNGSVG